MSNETRYVRILPSAVESKYGWSEESINTIWKLHKDKVNYYVIVGGKESVAFVSHIEPEHTKEVYVYDEPRGVVNHDTLTEPSQPTAKPMKVRVVKAEPSRWYYKWIGLEVDVVKDMGMLYGVNSGNLFAGYIRKEDCEIVTEPELMEPYYPNKLFKAAKTNKNVAMHLKEAATHAHLFDLAAQFRHYERALPSDEQQTEADGYDELLSEFNKPSGRTAAEYVGGDEPDRIAELEARVKALEEKHTATPLGMSDHSQCHGILPQLKQQTEPNYLGLLTNEQIQQMKKDVEAQVGETQPPTNYYRVSKQMLSDNIEMLKRVYPAPQPETNLERAKRLYPKGTRFKTLGTVAHTIVSSGEFKEEKRGIYDSNTKHYVLLDCRWAEIVGDGNGC